MAAGVAASVATPRLSFAQPRPPITFSKDVAPLIADRCGACHHPAGPAPFSLLTYEDVRTRAKLIALVTSRRLMPPWKSEPGYGEFVGHRPLSDAEIATIRQWVSDGAPEGDAGVQPKVAWTEGWQLGTPDLVVRLTESYRLRADGSDVWRVFVFPVPVNAMRYVRGLEFRPGVANVVHHARIRLDRTVTSRERDEEDPAPGYEGGIPRSAVYPDGHFLGWTPGQVGPLLPKGFAWRLEPGANLVVEMHMVPSGKAEEVAPSIGFYFTDDPPARAPAMLRLGRKNLDIAPGDKAYVSSDSFVLPVDTDVYAVQPHAHMRARQFTATATLPDGTRRWLLYIKDWDVRWQHLYQYVTPVALPRGTTIEMQFTFDNSVDNPRNPQLPPRRVRWGEEATKEMGELWMQVLTRDEPDLRALQAAIGPKMIAEDAVGYETRLQDDPSKVHLHDEAGDAYLSLGRSKEAVAHFEASLKARPGSASAHYNLAIALTEAGDRDQAVVHLRRALAIKPDYALAHNNLGSVLSAQGDQQRALEHFLEACRLDPTNPDASYNAGSVLRWAGDLPRAAEYFRRAVAAKPDWVLAVSSLAWLLATAPQRELRDASQAIELAERAADLSHRRDPGVIDIVAAAYAAAGQFDRALEAVRAALALNPNERLTAAIRHRERLYQNRQPFTTGAPR